MFKLIFIFLSSLILAGCQVKPPPQAVQPSPSPIDSAPNYVGWIEYTHPVYNYKIKYKYDWTQQPINPALPNQTIFVNIRKDEPLNKPHVSLEILVESSAIHTLDDFPPIVELVDRGYPTRQLTIDDSPAVFIDNLGPDGDLLSVFIQHGDYIYRLSSNQTEVGLIQSKLDTVLQSIASFEFVK